MRKLKLKATTEMSPKVLIKEMETKDMDYAFVVDKDRALVGVVTVDDCIKAMNEKVKIKEVLRTNYKTVPGNSYIKDIINVAMESSYPLAIVNEKNQILGIIPRSSILKALI